ncbi:BON domain-containing protein [Marinihelvus fidelis]|nr:BON domain-containing protein [Marinihelvus fidelis]
MNRKPIYIVMSAVLATTLSLPLAANESEARDMAEERADRTAGQVVDDLSIAARTKAALAADEVTDAINIDVEVDRDSVQLNGFVDSEAERERAETIAMNIDGVTEVVNNLEIQPADRSAGEYLDDKLLVSKVKAALVDNPEVEALTIDVEADHGVISLGGHVDTDEERDAAMAAANQVAGVVDVIDNIEVRS